MSISKWIEKSKLQAIQKDIETSVNGIVSSAARLPYDKQLEAIERMKKQMEERRDSINKEVAEINKTILSLNRI